MVSAEDLENQGNRFQPRHDQNCEFSTFDWRVPAHPSHARARSRRSLRSQQMPHDGTLVTDMECMQCLLIELIGMGHSRMLALMLDPALDDEAFDDSARLGNILPYIPTHGAIAIAFGAEAAQGRYELSKSCRLDPIFDVDENRTAVFRRLNRDDRLCPMVRGGQIG